MQLNDNRRVTLINKVRMPSNRSHLVTLCIFAMAATAASRVCGADQCEDHHALLQSIREARLRLTSGIYRAQGHRIIRTSEQGTMEGPVSVFCAFDYLNHRIRSDREDPIIFVDPQKQTESILQIGYRLIQLPGKAFCLDLGNGLKSSEILAITAPDFQPPPYGLPFDVRSFGLVDWSSIETPAPFEKVFEAFETSNILGCRSDAEGKCVLTMRPHESVKIELWVDCKQGYTVERSEMRLLDGAPDAWGDVVAFADVEWTDHDGVWVPISINLERHFNGREAYYAKLEWESVNKTLSDDLFQPSSLDVDPDSIIVDDRLGGKPVVVGKVRDNGQPPAPREGVGAPKSTRGRVFWIVAGNVAVLVILGGFLLFKRLRKT